MIDNTLSEESVLADIMRMPGRHRATFYPFNQLRDLKRAAYVGRHQLRHSAVAIDDDDIELLEA